LQNHCCPFFFLCLTARIFGYRLAGCGVFVFYEGSFAASSPAAEFSWDSAYILEISLPFSRRCPEDETKITRRLRVVFSLACRRSSETRDVSSFARRNCSDTLVSRSFLQLFGRLLRIENMSLYFYKKFGLPKDRRKKQKIAYVWKEWFQIFGNETGTCAKSDGSQFGCRKFGCPKKSALL